MLINNGKINNEIAFNLRIIFSLYFRGIIENFEKQEQIFLKNKLAIFVYNYMDN